MGRKRLAKPDPVAVALAELVRDVHDLPLVYVPGESAADTASRVRFQIVDYIHAMIPTPDLAPRAAPRRRMAKARRRPTNGREGSPRT